MKSVILIAICLLSLNAFAVSTSFCNSIYDSSQLTIHVGFDQRVSSVWLQKNSSSSETFFASFVYSTGQTSTYNLSGLSDFLVIDNTITDYGFGRAEIGKMIFKCN